MQLHKDNPWLYPELIRSADKLQLFAEKVLQNYASGIHSSRKVGMEQEFSQYRSYQHGDDLRWLDWKMYARSGRFYIKEADVHTQLFVRFVLDTSASMLHQDAKWNKLDYGKAIVAVLALAASRQGDETGLYAYNSESVINLLPQKEKRAINRLLHQLAAIDAKGKLPAEPDDLLLQPNKKELSVLITDFYQSKDEILQLIRKLKAAKNGLLVFHLIASNELELDQWKSGYTLEDLETGKQLTLNSTFAVQQAQKAYKQKLAEIKEEMLNIGVSYQLVNMKEQPHELINRFLKQRKLIA